VKQNPDDNKREFPHYRHDVAFSRKIQEKENALKDHQRVQHINKHHLISIKAANYKRDYSNSLLFHTAAAHMTSGGLGRGSQFTDLTHFYTSMREGLCQNSP